MINSKTLFAMLFTGAAFACVTTASDDTATFSTVAALGMLESLSADDMKGRKVGSPENARARKMIMDRFAEIGVEMLGDSYERPFVYGGFAEPGTGKDTAPSKAGVNVLGRIAGYANSDIAMVITAHYDHVGTIEGEIYNGADDNASGVVGLLAAAEHFTASQPEHDVYFVAFDAEEDGLGGARAFVADPPIDLNKVALILNFDMLARGDNGLLWVSGTSHWPQTRPLVERVAASAPVELKMGFDTGDGRDDWTLLSDHAAFFRAGIPHLYLGVEDHPDYHRPTDDFVRIDQQWFLNAIVSAIRLAEIMDRNLDDIFAMREISAAE